MPKFKKEKKVIRAKDGLPEDRFSPFSSYDRLVQEYRDPSRIYGAPSPIAPEAPVTRGKGRFTLKPGALSHSTPASALLRSMIEGPAPSSQASLDAPVGAVTQPPNVLPSDRVKAPLASGRSRQQPGIANQAAIESLVKRAPMATPSVPSVPEFTPSVAPMSEVNQGAMIKALMSGATGRGRSDLSDLSKAAGEIPKTKAGLKKFMQEYGKFIALGAMAGAGGKGGQIAAPIMAALPGLIEMMKGKKKGGKGFSGYSEYDYMTKSHGGPVGKKSSGGEPPKKSEGGAIRKFKGGSMKGNTKDSMLTPKYKKGGATGEMPQHKKMAMGKPTPQSMKQKFAKGGTMKCATGGVPKGYGISKKIRPTGPMD